MYISTNKSDKLENSQDNFILFILIYPYIFNISIYNLRAYSHFWNFIDKNLIYMKEYQVFENMNQVTSNAEIGKERQDVSFGNTRSIASFTLKHLFLQLSKWIPADVTKWDKNLDIVFVWSWYKPIYTEWKFFGSRWKFSRDP